MKMSHDQANYHSSSSKSRRCGTCSMYSDASGSPACSLVVRPIQPNDVCRYWRKKAVKHAER
jgi:hypothetical protein